MANKIKFQQIEGGDQLVLDAAQGLLDAAAALSAAQTAQSTADATDAAFVTFRDTTAPGLISTAKQQAIDAASTDATTKANTAKTAAKDYADIQDAAKLLEAQAYTDAKVAAAADDIGAFATANYVFSSVDVGDSYSPSLSDVITNSGITIKEGEKGLIHFTDSAFSGLLASETPIEEAEVFINGIKKVYLGGHVVVQKLNGVYNVVSIGASSYFQDIMAIRTLSMSQVSALDTRVTAAEGEIDTLQSDATALATRVTSAEGDIAQSQTDIGNLNVSIQGLQDRTTTAESKIDTLQSDATALAGRVTAVEGDVTTLETDLTAVTTRVTTAEGEIDTLQTDVTALDTRLDSAEASISQHTASIININENLVFFTEQINLQQASIDQHTLDIIALQAADVTMSGQISTLQADVVTAQQAAEGAQADADTAINNAATAQSAADAALTQANTVASDLATAIENLKEFSDTIKIEIADGDPRIGSSTIQFMPNIFFDNQYRTLRQLIATENGVLISRFDLLVTAEDGENYALVTATLTNPISKGDVFELNYTVRGKA